MIPNQSEIEQSLRAEIGRLNEREQKLCSQIQNYDAALFRIFGLYASVSEKCHKARRLAVQYRDSFASARARVLAMSQVRAPWIVTDAEDDIWDEERETLLREHTLPWEAT